MSDRVTRWLEALGLDEYAALFEQQQVVFDDLTELSDGDLEKIGIPLGPRKRILKAIAALSQDSPGPSDATATNEAEPFAESEGSLSAWERMPAERKPVTMLFADITDSTALTEKLDAEETHDLLYGATQRMCEVVEKYWGTVCKLMG